MDELWEVMECDEGAAARLAAEAGVSPIVARVLLNRGITTIADVPETS